MTTTTATTSSGSTPQRGVACAEAVRRTGQSSWAAQDQVVDLELLISVPDGSSLALPDVTVVDRGVF